MDEICAALGGRASEEIVFGKISTGALSDLEKITKQAYAMVTIYGLNEKIGNVSFYDSSGQQEYTFGKPYSEHTAEIIDTEVKKIITESYERTKDLLKDHKEELHQLASRLLEREVIFKEDLEQIFGKRKWEDKSEMAYMGPTANGTTITDTIPTIVVPPAGENQTTVVPPTGS
jgi:ATP-dependent Zn protease